MNSSLLFMVLQEAQTAMFIYPKRDFSLSKVQVLSYSLIESLLVFRLTQREVMEFSAFLQLHRSSIFLSTLIQERHYFPNDTYSFSLLALSFSILSLFLTQVSFAKLQSAMDHP